MNFKKIEKRIKANLRNKLFRFSLFIFLFALLLSISCENSESSCEEKKCSDFDTQSEAQSTFDSDPNCYDNLDRDNDKFACENLPN